VLFSVSRLAYRVSSCMTTKPPPSLWLHVGSDRHLRAEAWGSVWRTVSKERVGAVATALSLSLSLPAVIMHVEQWWRVTENYSERSLTKFSRPLLSTAIVVCSGRQRKGWFDGSDPEDCSLPYRQARAST